jgi:hypothetical protein
MTAGDRLPALKVYCPKLKEACTQALKAILEENNLPKDPEGLLEKMNRVPTYFNRWKQSAVRASVNRVLAMVKAHHPNIDLPVVTSGLPELKADGTPLEMKEFHEIFRSLRGLSTSIVQKLKLDKFFYPCGPDNKPVQPVKTIGVEKMPAVTTLAAAEAYRPKSPAKA